MNKPYLTLRSAHSARLEGWETVVPLPTLRDGRSRALLRVRLL
jgi:hypothetical protein